MQHGHFVLGNILSDQFDLGLFPELFDLEQLVLDDALLR
jgi:hypothetical protein